MLAGMTENLPAVLDDGPDDPLPPLVLGWIAGKRSVHTRQAYARDIAGWLGWCAEYGIDPLEATEPEYAGFARRLEASGCTLSTAARKMSVVSSWYKWLIRNGHAEKNPADYVDRPKVDRNRSTTPGLTKDQALAMLAAADYARGDQRLRTSALVAVLLFSGARVSEALAADVEDLGTDRGHRVLWVTRKGGERQPLGLPPPVTERLDAYLASRDDMSSLPALPGQPGAPRPRRVLFITGKGQPMLRREVWVLIRRLGKAAGLPPDLVAHLGPHAMRHAFATLYLDAGGSLRDLQDAMGHSDPATTRRYDRARYSLDRSPGYLLASYLAAPEGES